MRKRAVGVALVAVSAAWLVSTTAANEVIDDAATISRTFTAIGGMVVDAKDQQAAAFYEKYEFIRIEENGLQLFLPIQDCISLMNA